MLITISQTTISPTQNYLGSVPVLKGWYSKRFTAGDGITPVVPGDGISGFYYSVSCAINGDGQIVIPAFTIQSTTDATDDATSRFTGQLFDQSGTPREIIFGKANGNGWAIPTQYGTPVDWDELARYNAATALLNPPPTYPTYPQMLAEIERRAGDFDYAEVGHAGIAELTTAPLLASRPKAVSETDPRLMTQVGILGLPVNPKNYGAIGTGVATTITTADVLTHSAGQPFPWAGTYTVGVDTKDYVGLQEAIYAGLYNGTLTPNDANSKLNRPIDWGAGFYVINKGLVADKVRSALITGAGNYATVITCTAAEPALSMENGLWYSYFANFAMGGSTAHTGAVIQIEGIGALSQQYTTWVNVYTFGGGLINDGWGLNVNGGLQGDGNRWTNCRAAAFTYAGVHTSGSNTLNNQWVGGDIQSCPNYGIAIDGQSTMNIDGPTFQNGNNVADIFVGGGVTQSKSSASNIRSESKVFCVGVGADAPIELSNIEAPGYGWVSTVNGGIGVSDWLALTVVTTSKYTIGNGRLFKITTAGTTGAAEPSWDTCLSDGGTLADGSATWTQQEWNIVNIDFSSIDHCFFGLGRVNVGIDTGTGSLRTAINDMVVSRTDWFGDMGVSSQGMWLGNPVIQTALGVQVRKMTWAVPQWEQSALVAYGNRANTLSWSAANRAVQPTSYNPMFVGDSTFIASKAVSAGLGFGDVGWGHGAPDSGGIFNGTSLDADYRTQNCFGVWGTISPGRIPVGSNQQGQDLYIQGGPSTGNLPSGNVYVRVGAAGAGGAQVNPTANMIAITPSGVAVAGGVTSSSATSGVGYSTGAGGTVTQATNKSTGVTLNKASGSITTNNAALAAGAEVSFVVTNSVVAATDVPVIVIKSVGTLGAYAVVVSAVGAGSFTVTISNLTAGSLSEAIILSFVIIKGVAA